MQDSDPEIPCPVTLITPPSNQLAGHDALAPAGTKSELDDDVEKESGCRRARSVLVPLLIMCMLQCGSMDAELKFVSEDLQKEVCKGQSLM